MSRNVEPGGYPGNNFLAEQLHLRSDPAALTLGATPQSPRSGHGRSSSMWDAGQPVDCGFMRRGHVRQRGSWPIR